MVKNRQKYSAKQTIRKFKFPVISPGNSKSIVKEKYEKN